MIHFPVRDGRSRVAPGGLAAGAARRDAFPAQPGVRGPLDLIRYASAGADAVVMIEHTRREGARVIIEGASEGAGLGLAICQRVVERCAARVGSLERSRPVAAICAGCSRR